MVVDGVLGFMVIWRLWRWKWWSAALLVVPLVTIDAVFLSANLLKLFEGAWLPVLFGAAMVLLIVTWQKGSRILIQKTRRIEVPLDSLIKSLEKRPPHVVPGTAVFLTSDPEFAPASLMHNLKHNKVLHEHNVILTISVADTPRVPDDDRVRCSRSRTGSRACSFASASWSRRTSRKALRRRAQAGPAVRHHVDVVLPLAALAESGREARDAGLAGPALHRSCAFRQRRHRLLPDPTGRVVEVGTQVTV